MLENQTQYFIFRKIQKESIKELYQRGISNEIDESFTGTADVIYEYIKQKVKNVAYEILGIKMSGKKNRYWITDDMKEKIIKKRETFIKRISPKRKKIGQFTKF